MTAPELRARHTAAALLFAALAAFACRDAAPGAARDPATATPRSLAGSLAPLRDAFDAASSRPRFVALLSPS